MKIILIFTCFSNLFLGNCQNDGVPEDTLAEEANEIVSYSTSEIINSSFLQVKQQKASILELARKYTSISDDEDEELEENSENLKENSPISFETIEFIDGEELEDFNKWIENTEENIVNIPYSSIYEQLKKDLEEYKRDLSHLEDFETVEKNEIIYTMETLKEKIRNIENFLSLLEIDEELKKLEKELKTVNSKNKRIEKIDKTMDNARDFVKALEGQEYVIVTNNQAHSSYYLSKEVSTTIETLDNLLENKLATLVADSEGSTEEDLLETEAAHIEKLISVMEKKDSVTINGIKYDIPALQEWSDSNYQQIEDMDSIDDIKSDIKDVSVQFSIPNLNPDDITDEIEEINELLEQDSRDVFYIGKVKYTRDKLEDIIEKNQEALKQFIIDMEFEDIKGYYNDNYDEIHIDNDDFEQGLQEIDDLIEAMDDNDVVVVGNYELNKEDLIEQYEEVLLDQEDQLQQKLSDAITNTDPETTDFKELKGLIENAEKIYDMIEENEVVELYSEEYDKEELEDFIEDLKENMDELEENAEKNSEMQDINNLFKSFEGVIDFNGFKRLEEELGELNKVLKDEDTVEIGSENFYTEDIDELIYFLKVIGDEMLKGMKLDTKEFLSLNQ